MKKVVTTLGVLENFTAACRECNVTHNDFSRGNRNGNNEVPRAASGADSSSSNNNTNNTTSAYSNPITTPIKSSNIPVPTSISPAPPIRPSIRRIREHRDTPSLPYPIITAKRSAPTLLHMACNTPLPITTIYKENYIYQHTKCWAIARLVTPASTSLTGTTAVVDSGSKWNIRGNTAHFISLCPLESDQSYIKLGDDKTTVKIEGWGIQDVFLNGQRVQQAALMLLESIHPSSQCPSISNTKDVALLPQTIKLT